MKHIIENNEQKILQMNADGVSNKEIGEQIGCHGASIGQFLKKRGLKSKDSIKQEARSLENFKDEIIKMWEEGSSIGQIEKTIGITAVSYSLKKWGYSNTSRGARRYHGDPDIEQKARELYESGMGIESIGRVLNTNGCTVRNKLLEQGVKMRAYGNKKYDVDESYFEKIDTPNKAYILGLLYTDGNVCRTSIRIRLQCGDINILNKIKREIKSTAPIKNIKNNLKDGGQIQKLLRINSAKMCCDLEKLGCMPNKTFKLRFPTEDMVPKHLIKHFIRGCWDGDGSIAKSGHSCSFCGNLSMCNSFKEVLPSENFAMYQAKNGSNPDNPDLCAHKLSIFRINNIHSVLEFLYGDCAGHLYLDRKYEQAMNILKKKPDEISVRHLSVSR